MSLLRSLCFTGRCSTKIPLLTELGMKTNGHKARKAAKVPVFVARAQRAMRRAAKGVHSQHRAWKLPVVVWQNGKVVEKPA